MLQFTQKYAASDPERFSGHLSFDFLVDREEVKAAEKDSSKDVALYAIECNPCAHTAVVLFNGTREMIQGYLSLLEEPHSSDRMCEGLVGESSVPSVYPRQCAKF
jgi:catechol O-methyltransferase